VVGAWLFNPNFSGGVQMLEEVEALGRQITINYDTRMWHIATKMENGSIEQTFGRKFEDAFDALKLRLNHESN
jgi:hypothetical protein